MAKIEANWECTNCERENFVRIELPKDLKRKIYCCFNCGRAHSMDRISKDKKNFLECIPFEGIGKDTPLGVNIDAGTKVMSFGDPLGGGNLSRGAYAKKFGWDPVKLLCNVKPDRDICKLLEGNTMKKTAVDLGDLRKIILELSINDTIE